MADLEAKLKWFVGTIWYMPKSARGLTTIVIDIYYIYYMSEQVAGKWLESLRKNP